MQEQRAFVISKLGKDVHDLIVKYLIREILQPLRTIIGNLVQRWPDWVYFDDDFQAIEHEEYGPIMCYFAARILVSIEPFYNFLKKATHNFKRETRVYLCGCGELIANDFMFKKGGKLTTDNFVGVYEYETTRFCSTACITGCNSEKNHSSFTKDKLKVMPACEWCYERDEEAKKRIRERWEKIQNKSIF
jgi:hypothetical protein